MLTVTPSLLCKTHSARTVRQPLVSRVLVPLIGGPAQKGHRGYADGPGARPPVSGSVPDLLCGLRQLPPGSLDLIFPKEKISHSLFAGTLKDRRRGVGRAFKDAQVKRIRKALI